MQYDGRLALRVAAHFPMDAVAVANVQHAAVMRLDFGIEVRHRWNLSHREPLRSRAATHRGRARMILAFALLLGSAVTIYFSCEFFVNGVEWVGRRLKMMPVS